MKILIVFALICATMIQTSANPIQHCPAGWLNHSGRCFLYVPRKMTWTRAEKNCQSMGGNLASVHSFYEYHGIQVLIKAISHYTNEAWIGGSNGEQLNVWLWTDGSSFHYSDWCKGEPNNGGGSQHCLQINYSGDKCWDDLGCDDHLPFVCARKPY